MKLEEYLKHWRKRRKVGGSAYEYLVSICPYVTPENVEELLDEIPAEDQLEFRHRVIYQRLNAIVGSAAAHGSYQLGEDFYSGLKVFRDYFAKQGTLQFGDYLFMEQTFAESFLHGLKKAAKPHQIAIGKAEEKLDLLKRLAEIYPPVVFDSGQ